MAETTEYLGLTRPTEADFFSVSHFNENMDTLDANAEATAAAASSNLFSTKRRILPAITIPQPSPSTR